MQLRPLKELLKSKTRLKIILNVLKILNNLKYTFMKHLEKLMIFLKTGVYLKFSMHVSFYVILHDSFLFNHYDNIDFLYIHFNFVLETQSLKCAVTLCLLNYFL